MKRIPDELPWLVMGGPPGGPNALATCQRCGRCVPEPPLPLSLVAFDTYLQEAIMLHINCTEDGDDRTLLVTQERDS